METNLLDIDGGREMRSPPFAGVRATPGRPIAVLDASELEAREAALADRVARRVVSDVLAELRGAGVLTSRRGRHQPVRTVLSLSAARERARVRIGDLRRRTRCRKNFRRGAHIMWGTRSMGDSD